VFTQEFGELLRTYALALRELPAAERVHCGLCTGKDLWVFEDSRPASLGVHVHAGRVFGVSTLLCHLRQPIPWH
jgi:hypothetical protein